jgi:hypothetical protein
MAHTTYYQPIFRGQFPSKARKRWAAIRKFVNLWCMPDGSPLLESFDDNGLIETAQSRCSGELSYSIKCWLALVEQAASLGKPTIRDCPAVEPIEDHINDDSVRDATVILISGENDLFWAVANTRLTDDDPPVDVFQRYDSSSPALVGQNKSVSEFVLKYLCMYNEIAVKNREWFSADGTEEDVRGIRAWFNYSLAFDSKDGWCGPFEIFEKKDVVAIVRRTRLEVSVFCDPETLEMPSFLKGEMKRHVELRQKYTQSK